MSNPSIHYIGSNVGSMTDHARCVATWNGIVRQHQGEYRPSPAYNFGVCNTHGQFFVGRGWELDSAANGPGQNRGSRALLVMVGPDDIITPTCERVVGEWAREAVNNHGMQWPLRPHSSYVPTACPGDQLRAIINKINSGTTGEEFTMNDEDEQKLSQWEKDTRAIILQVLIGTYDQATDRGILGTWEKETRRYIDEQIKASEARIIAAING